MLVREGDRVLTLCYSYIPAYNTESALRAYSQIIVNKLVFLKSLGKTGLWERLNANLVKLVRLVASCDEQPN